MQNKTPNLDRRKFLLGSGAIAATALATSLLPGCAFNTKDQALYPVYKDGAYQVKDFSALTKDKNLGLSAPLLEHHLGLYKGYVDKVNAAEKYFAAYTQGELDTAHTKNLAFALNGMALHDIYFTNMSSENSKRSGALNKAIDASFGSFSNYVQNLVNIARQSKGWSLTCVNLLSGKLVNYGIATHSENFPNFVVPILALDVYEHAYDKDFGVSSSGKDKYLEIFMRIIDWVIVSRRFSKAI